MDVGPLVMPHAQAAKLGEPAKCTLHDPPPPAQAAPVSNQFGRLAHQTSSAKWKAPTLAGMPVQATSPTSITFLGFCYTLSGFAVCVVCAFCV